MSCYHAEIINLSLKNDKVVKNFQILNIKKRFLGFVRLYTIAVPEHDMNKTVIMFQKNMGTKMGKEWYITFHNEERVIIVFRNRVFDLSGKGIEPIYQKLMDTTNAQDKEKWDEMIKYAKSLGIPDDQCDFLPVDFMKQEYE